MAYPIQWSGYFQDALTRKNTIYSPGLVSTTFVPVNEVAGEISERWYNDDLESVVTHTRIASDSTTVTAGALTSDVEKHAVYQSGFGMKEAQFDAIRKGSSGIDGAITQIADTAIRDDQTIMKAVMDGVFATALNSTHYTDFSGSAISGKLFNELAWDSLGEAADELTTIVMHSNTMRKLSNVMGYDEAEKFGIAAAGLVRVLNGLRVVINDTVCAASSNKYPVYLSGDNALFTEYHENLRILEDDKPAVGGGTKEYYVYRTAKYGVNGVGWASSSAPTSDSDLQTGSNWTKKLDNKQILLLKADVS